MVTNGQKHTKPELGHVLREAKGPNPEGHGEENPSTSNKAPKGSMTPSH